LIELLRALVLANEYNAISLVVMYWTETVPQWAWILIFWVLFLSLSMLGVLAYGEVEFWLSLYGIRVTCLAVADDKQHQSHLDLGVLHRQYCDIRGWHWTSNDWV